MAALLTSFHGLVDRVSELRRKLNLPSPGQYENLHREVKMVLPTVFLIQGAKFELTSYMNPSFQTTHSLAWGSAQNPPTYHYGALFLSGDVMLHGQVDHSGSLTARANYNWIPLPPPKPHPVHDPSNPEAPPQQPQHPEQPRLMSTSKLMAMFNSSNPAQNVLQLEHDHIDLDWSLNVKATNANLIDSAPSWSSKQNQSTVTGQFSISYLQSVTQSLALGAELAYQRPVPDVEEPALSYSLRWCPPPSALPTPTILPPGVPSPYQPVNPKDPTQIFALTWSPEAGFLNSTYWRRINQRLELGTELQMLLTPATRSEPGKREGVASFGFKLDTLFATVRGMVDTRGRVSAVVEERIAQGISLLLSGEIDYGRGGGGAGRVGIGFNFEA
eukprot:jgi/Hompol1/6417/HPOL_004041-RA